MCYAYTGATTNDIRAGSSLTARRPALPPATAAHGPRPSAARDLSEVSSKRSILLLRSMGRLKIGHRSDRKEHDNYSTIQARMSDLSLTLDELELLALVAPANKNAGSPCAVLEGEGELFQIPQGL